MRPGFLHQRPLLARSSIGSDSCPTTFNTFTKQWNFTLTYVSDYYDRPSGAGCFWYPLRLQEIGPTVYAEGTVDCSSGGDVCQEAEVIDMGSMTCVGACIFFPGATWTYGTAACWPADASYKLCVDGGTSPIIIDVDGNGYQLTSAAAGVQFDFYGSGTPIQIAWTDGSSTNAFLALPGPDGKVSSGQQLFGNVTPQPECSDPNGFLSLAQYDSNNDGVIDAKDPIFSQLRLWQDTNHDGVSQAWELHTLSELGVVSISLNYEIKKRTDQYGNQFRHRARVSDAAGKQSKWAYDVILAQQ